MRGAVILNGISRHKKKFYEQIYPSLAARHAITVLETKSPGHAKTLAAYAVTEKFDFILAAGGDGTLNQVLNGMLQHGHHELPALGLIPLGTGNDFARYCGLSPQPESVLGLLARSPKATDIGRVSCRSSEGIESVRYYINCCSIGMGPEVVQRLETNDRFLGPTFTYLKSIIVTFFAQRLPLIKCTVDDWEWSGRIRVLAVANAQSFGNAVYIAPEAVVDDGRLNVFIAGDFNTLKFIFYLLRLKLKQKVADKGIVYRQATVVSLNSEEVCAIETEGELAGYLPATVTILPGKIRFFR